MSPTFKQQQRHVRIADVPAATFGKTAFADFASVRYSFESGVDTPLSNSSNGTSAQRTYRLPHSAKPHSQFCLSEVYV